jgi:NADPH-dependent 2,4-dienoyl-CoA reductase/sulfur reductase-like enzyme
VVVIGGGFGGASCARALRRYGKRISVTLVEADARFTACPRSNSVIAGLHELAEQQFTYDRLSAEGIAVINAKAEAVDPQARAVALVGGDRLKYDRLVLSPGIDFRWSAVPGYDETAVRWMPHAWRAGEQTLLLRRQLIAMRNGGLVVIAPPANPSRCPSAPYERASLIAHYLKASKPRSKVLILDAKDGFPLQRLFEKAWEALYPGMIEWVALSQGGEVISVDPASNTLETDFGRHKADVANVIPPQKAGSIAEAAGVADRTGWCPIDPSSFESTLQPRIHVIGDSLIGGAMPKSGAAASSQGKDCAAKVAALLAGRADAAGPLESTCYSVVAPDYAFSQSGQYRAARGTIAEIPGTGHFSAEEAPRALRAREAQDAEAWFRGITGELFG